MGETATVAVGRAGIKLSAPSQNDGGLVEMVSSDGAKQWESRGRRFFVFAYGVRNGITVYAKDNDTGRESRMVISDDGEAAAVNGDILRIFAAELSGDRQYGRILGPHLKEGCTYQ